ncbi:MAG TPA: hypothetical protein VE710_23270 [Candidatus Bathyarchaeia archaeon]|nr:hypothetical protein [Candidatus Bathyarchaeia archaeon]
MHRIGVVGPLPSINRILEVSNEFEHEIDFYPFSYEDPREVKEIVKSQGSKVNGWFFSGPIPFMMAKQVFGADASYIYCPTTGASLYKCLLQLINDQKQPLEAISIDMIRSENVQESLIELGIPIPNHYVKDFGEEYDLRELQQFHLQLWKEGKTQGALTCLYGVQKALEQEGMPVYRIQMTKMEIRQTMKILIEKVRSSYFKDTQIGVEIIEVDQFDQIAQKSTVRYYLKHMELRMKQALLLLCEKIDGSLMENGNGRYQIFSTRGAIEREYEMLYHTVQQLSLEIEAPVSVGIGFGETAFSAEMHARKAIQHANESAEGGIVVVEDDGMLIESPGQKEELAYHFRSDDKELLDHLNKANISVKTYKRIEALVARMGWDGFTTSDLAVHLSMTIRNAQRIMGRLCDVDLAEMKGEELHSTRGRPSKIYRLK